MSMELADTTQMNAKNTSEKRKKNLLQILIEIIAVIICSVVFLIPFYFIVINSFKSKAEAAEMSMSWPSTFHIVENFTEVLTASNGMLLRAFFNSTFITVISVIILIVVCSMTGFILQRRKGKSITMLSFLFLAGLMIPPAIVPTIWLLNLLGLFKTMPGIILIMVALAIPLSIILYSGFIATIPKEIDEAAFIDGCGTWRLFFSVIFPMLKPIHSTIIILSAVSIFNDFVHPLYFFPGAKNATLQLTLYNFTSMYNTSWNLLFANVLLITIPPFILFMFFSKRIVSGMTSGAIKA